MTPEDVVFADTDGVLFVASDRIAEVLEIAAAIYEKERRQAELIRSGRSLGEQLQFGAFLQARAADPAYTLRRHVEKVCGAIET